MLPTKGDSFFNNIDRFLNTLVGQTCSFFMDLFSYSKPSRTAPATDWMPHPANNLTGIELPQNQYPAGNYGARRTSFAAGLEQDQSYAPQIRSRFNGRSFGMQPSPVLAPAFVYGGYGYRR